MLKSGLSRGYACAAMSVGSLITATIPPSVGLIIYGYLGNVSIGRLFAGGIIPGILMTFALMGTAYVIAKRRGYTPELKEIPSGREIGRATWDCKWALLFPVFLIVGIRYGIFTPSEAGAFAIAYAIRHRFPGLSRADLRQDRRVAAPQRAGHRHDHADHHAVVDDRLRHHPSRAVPQTAAEFLTGLTSNKYVLMMLLVAFIIFLGCLLESTVIVLLLTPILVPVVQAAGIDLVHFGLVMMTATTLGSMTPPVGVAMFAVCGIMKCPMNEYAREAVPFLAAVIALILVMIVLPDLVLVIPDWVFGPG